MILKGSQRAGGIQLANHLMNDVDNDHVALHELRGFVADDLHGAMKEAFAISRGTKRCRQFLFSLSLNPPERARVTVAEFEQAIAKVEKRLGLSGQPRAIVFHEKESRRHCHAVWLRVDTSRMRAINLPYFKSKLREQSRELFLEHGWHLPKGLANSKDREPTNYGLSEWQQSKRIGVDPKAMKALVQRCWSRCADMKSFQAALEQSGLVLAKGDRRGHVIVDFDGNAYAVSRWVGVRAKDVREKLGKPEILPTVGEAKAILAKRAGAGLQSRLREQQGELEKAEAELKQRLHDMRHRQRVERTSLAQRHEKERFDANRSRSSLLPTGLKAVWFRLTGKYAKIKQQIEQTALEQLNTQRQETEGLIRSQLLELKALQHDRLMFRRRVEARHSGTKQELTRSELDQRKTPIHQLKRGRS